jgi:hypothetical protein
LAFAVAFGGLGVSPAFAQATRTWVSGVGDDLNPCSRTAPCKTFAGAISKTAASGEIDCLDPGAFGAVTITKALSIICQYTEAGVLATLGSNAIVVNAPATSAVVLSGMDIQGAGTGLNGIRFIAGASLTVENSRINGFGNASGLGISFQPSGSSQLFISDTTINNNGSTGGGGILIQPTGAGGNARVHMTNVRFFGNANDAIRVNTTGNTSAAGINVVIENSQISGSSTGISLIVPAGTNSATLNIADSTIFNNPSTALSANGAGATIRASGNLIVGNGQVTTIAAGGTITSYGDNRTQGNVAAAAFTPPPLVKN